MSALGHLGGFYKIPWVWGKGGGSNIEYRLSNIEITRQTEYRISVRVLEIQKFFLARLRRARSTCPLQLKLASAAHVHDCTPATRQTTKGRAQPLPIDNTPDDRDWVQTSMSAFSKSKNITCSLRPRRAKRHAARIWRCPFCSIV